MVEKNKCVDCGDDVLDTTKRKCNNCIKKPKKKHLSNFEIDAKYMQSVNKVGIAIKNSIDKINAELFKLSFLNGKFLLNEKNQKLLGSKMDNLISFKEYLIKHWQQTFENGS